MREICLSAFALPRLGSVDSLNRIKRISERSDRFSPTLGSPLREGDLNQEPDGTCNTVNFRRYDSMRLPKQAQRIVKPLDARRRHPSVTERQVAVEWLPSADSVFDADN
jgi:hypothetical protein